MQDFRLKILDGRTGKQKAAADTPFMDVDRKDRPVRSDERRFARVRQSVRRADAQGNHHQESLRFVLGLQQQAAAALEGPGADRTLSRIRSTSDGDGREELYIGYAKWSPDGKQLWSHDTELKDHADGVMAGNLTADPKAKPRAYYSGSDEGFIVIDETGAIVTHQRVGHTQSPSVAKYRPDLPGLQYMTINFWKNPGIITLFDADGKILAQEEPIHTGTALLPVNWRGDPESAKRQAAISGRRCLPKRHQNVDGMGLRPPKLSYNDALRGPRRPHGKSGFPDDGDTGKGRRRSV